MAIGCEGAGEGCDRAGRRMNSEACKVAYVVGFAIGSGIRCVYTSACRENIVADDRRTRLDSLLVALAGMGLVVPLVHVFSPWLAFADYRMPVWVGPIGAAAFVFALWLLFRSHADLGRNWSPTAQIREDHWLVTFGVYDRIRHPMYAAHWLWGVAQVLLLHNWVAGPALVLTFLPLYLTRVPREEQMMLDRFGEDYRAYIERTGRIVPRLWG